MSKTVITAILCEAANLGGISQFFHANCSINGLHSSVEYRLPHHPLFVLKNETEPKLSRKRLYFCGIYDHFKLSWNFSMPLYSNYAIVTSLMLR